MTREDSVSEEDSLACLFCGEPSRSNANGFIDKVRWSKALHSPKRNDIANRTEPPLPVVSSWETVSQKQPMGM